MLRARPCLQHSLVGSVEKRGISGGQRKRVNIGLELVAKPSLLFMDEPTSGLDATAATDILAALRKYTSLSQYIPCSCSKTGLPCCFGRTFFSQPCNGDVRRLHVI